MSPRRPEFAVAPGTECSDPMQPNQSAKKSPAGAGHEESKSIRYLVCGDIGGVVAGGVTEGVAGAFGAGVLCVGVLFAAVRTLSLL